jgi:hypothetical protein
MAPKRTGAGSAGKAMAGQESAGTGRGGWFWRPWGVGGTRLGHGATCRARASAAQAATGGSRERRSASRRRAIEAASVRPRGRSCDLHTRCIVSRPRRRCGGGYLHRSTRRHKRRGLHHGRRWDERSVARPGLRPRRRPRWLSLVGRESELGRSQSSRHARGFCRGRWVHASRMRYGRTRHDVRSPCMARRQHPVQPKKRVARRRHHGRQACEAHEGRHHTLLDAAAPSLLDAVNDEADATQRQARATRRTLDARGSGTIARARGRRAPGHGRWRAG